MPSTRSSRTTRPSKSLQEEGRQIKARRRRGDGEAELVDAWRAMHGRRAASACGGEGWRGSGCGAFMLSPRGSGREPTGYDGRRARGAEGQRISAPVLLLLLRERACQKQQVGHG